MQFQVIFFLQMIPLGGCRDMFLMALWILFRRYAEYYGGIVRHDLYAIIKMFRCYKDNENII